MSEPSPIAKRNREAGRQLAAERAKDKPNKERIDELLHEIHMNNREIANQWRKRKVSAQGV